MKERQPISAEETCAGLGPGDPEENVATAADAVAASPQAASTHQEPNVMASEEFDEYELSTRTLQFVAKLESHPAMLELQTVSAGEQGPKVRITPLPGWTVGHVKAALAARGCGPAAEIDLIYELTQLTDTALLNDLDNPNGMIAVTPMAPTKDSSTVDDSLIEPVTRRSLVPPGGDGGADVVLRCGFCGLAGHNIAGCEQLVPVAELQAMRLK